MTITNSNGVNYYRIEEIQQRPEASGGFFFSKGASRFFSSRISEVTYCGGGGVYFVTSEQFHGVNSPDGERSYTVRQFDAETADISTAGNFQGLTRYRAHKIAKQLAEGEV